MQTTLFPHDTVRDQQDILIDGVLRAIDTRGKLVVHAPTGLGKTAATLAPAIERALALDKVVIFMTSRLTQHALALQTVSRIRQRHNIAIPVVDLIGKKHMCLQPGVDRLGGKEFAEYCKSMREDSICEYYTRLKQNEQPSQATRSVIVQLGNTAPNTPEQVKMICAEEEHSLCPYEITMMLAKEARVIIADYSYIFNETIRDNFFRRINRELVDCILVVDEGHNLPERVKDLASERISTFTLRRAATELTKMQQEDHLHHLRSIGDLLQSLGAGLRMGNDESYISRDQFLDGVRHICPPEQLIDALNDVATSIREEQKSSSCGAIADFLTAWSGDDDGFTRIISLQNDREDRSEESVRGTSERDDGSPPAQLSLFGVPVIPALSRPALPASSRPQPLQLSYRCLDPAVITRPVFEAAFATVVMSGTLTPTDMYARLIGIDDATQLTLRSPFPTENRINIVVPKTTTKFTTRSVQMYQEIATVCGELLSAIPGNAAIFLPSYKLLGDVRVHIEHLTSKTVFAEHPSFTKEEREDLLLRFKQYKSTGAVLLGVMGGSFSEGIDLPGDELRAVIIIGLPLGRPDLETKALIAHYDRKFGRGWDYGYTFPAFNKTLQSAGRCIRTETDKGAVIFVDERYSWKRYYDCFPEEWNIAVTTKYVHLLRAFFSPTGADDGG